MFRSSHRKCSVTKSVLINFAIFTGKHLCQILFFNKVAVCCRRKVAAVKIEKLKAFIIKYYDITTYSVQFHLFHSVNLLYFFYPWFQSSILHKLKNTLNCWLKLNKDNNWVFLVVYTASILVSIKLVWLSYL